MPECSIARLPALKENTNRHLGVGDFEGDRTDLREVRPPPTPLLQAEETVGGPAQMATLGRIRRRGVRGPGRDLSDPGIDLRRNRRGRHPRRAGPGHPIVTHTIPQRTRTDALHRGPHRALEYHRREPSRMSDEQRTVTSPERLSAVGRGSSPQGVP